MIERQVRIADLLHITSILRSANSLGEVAEVVRSQGEASEKTLRCKNLNGVKLRLLPERCLHLRLSGWLKQPS